MTDDSSLSPDEALRRQHLERMATAANIHVRRKEYAEALNTLQQVLELDPRQHSIHRAMGDIYLGQKKPREALEHYEAALALAPGEAEYERGAATAKLALAELERTRERVQELAEHPQARKASTKKLALAAGAGIVFPGLGQLHNGEHIKGGILASLGALDLVWLIWMMVEFALSKARTGHFSNTFGVLALVACFVMVGLIAYGVLDAVNVARRQEGTDDLTEV